MPLAPGARLGPYEIVSPVGAGGMGEVYRARDTRLDRTVAIKVLPEQFATDPHLLERFDREARAISSLNHPHICALYDIGREQDINFLVMEFLDGETLADRLARSRDRALRVDEALRIAIDIADALRTAHRSGIVHRDLKPANVFLARRTGSSDPPVAKLLDFGLAKSATPAIATSGLSMLPTTPPNLTAQGTILGTFQYMAPEQIEGLEADARTDIFAFGALLFEMFAGRPAFEGKTRAQLLGAILKDDPPPISSLRPDAPGALDRFVATCLAKDPDDRWQTARDLLRELKWAATALEQPAAPAGVSTAPSMRGRRHSIRARLFAAALAFVATGASVIVVKHLRETAPSAEPMQFTIAPPENAQFGGPAGGGSGAATQIAISPDGRHVVFVARSAGKYTLWLRTLATIGFRQLPGTDDASFPFWSPDSRYIAFFGGGKLKKVQIAGGPPVTLCDAVQGRGGTWNRDNVIVFGILASALQRVSSAGGTPAQAARLDSDYGELSHRWPHFLPDGRHFLFTAVTGAAGAAPRPSLIKIGALDSPDATTLLRAESSVQFGDGHLLFLRDTSLMAQPFDTSTLRFTGDPFPVAEEISTEGSRYASYSLSASGILLYAHGGLLSSSALRWFDRSGKSLGQVGEAAAYLNLSLSPDERQVAAGVVTGSPPNTDIWIIDVARNVPSRFTFDPSFEAYPIWSPDSRRLAFLSGRVSESGIHVKPATGIGEETAVLTSSGPTRAGVAATPTDWSPDGKFIVYQISGSGPTNTDLWAVPLDSARKPFPVVARPGPETMAAFSPDGRWLAYVGTDAGVPQVYVQSFPTTAGQFQVSKDGGTQPQWRSDGKELFFVAPDGTMMAATIDAGTELRAGIPQALFASAVVSVGNNRQYAVTKDGQRFLVLVPRSSDRNATSLPLTVVVNWLAAVQK